MRVLSANNERQEEEAGDDILKHEDDVKLKLDKKKFYFRLL